MMVGGVTLVLLEGLLSRSEYSALFDCGVDGLASRFGWMKLGLVM